MYSDSYYLPQIFSVWRVFFDLISSIDVPKYEASIKMGGETAVHAQAH